MVTSAGDAGPGAWPGAAGASAAPGPGGGPAAVARRTRTVPHTGISDDRTFTAMVTLVWPVLNSSSS